MFPMSVLGWFASSHQVMGRSGTTYTIRICKLKAALNLNYRRIEKEDGEIWGCLAILCMT